MPRARPTAEPPEGLVYEPELITPEEERLALELLHALDFRELTMRGQTARRTVRHYGFDYGYDSWTLTPGEPLPDDLAWLRERAAALADVAPTDLAQTLVTRYPAGASIGWHRDAPMFGPKIVGISLVSACRLRLRQPKLDPPPSYELELEPRSGYVLGGEARSAWQHSIPPTKELRYSLTFRTLRNPARRRSR